MALFGDDAIRATNDDASMCKRYAVDKGYWVDPYIQYVTRKGEKRQPEISRGYYARIRGVRQLLMQFLEVTKNECQIVNLGAGFDTLYWNLVDEGKIPKRFIEVDFQHVTAKKCHAIKCKQQLLEKLSSEEDDISLNRTDLHSPKYHLVAADLRNLKEFKQKLDESKIDYSLPTVFIAECVLVYVDADKSTALLSWIAEAFTSSFFINYEQVNMTDRFGEIMTENLKARDCILHGVDHCKNLESQEKRFTSVGWESAEAWAMTTVYKNLPQADVRRIEKLEFLDETELLQQLFEHYCICWAYKDGSKLGFSHITMNPT